MGTGNAKPISQETTNALEEVVKEQKGIAGKVDKDEKAKKANVEAQKLEAEKTATAAKEAAEAGTTVPNPEQELKDEATQADETATTDEAEVDKPKPQYVCTKTGKWCQITSAVASECSAKDQNLAEEHASSKKERKELMTLPSIGRKKRKSASQGSSLLSTKTELWHALLGNEQTPKAKKNKRGTKGGRNNKIEAISTKSHTEARENHHDKKGRKHEGEQHGGGGGGVGSDAGDGSGGGGWTLKYNCGTIVAPDEGEETACDGDTRMSFATVKPVSGHFPGGCADQVEGSAEAAAGKKAEAAAKKAEVVAKDMGTHLGRLELKEKVEQNQANKHEENVVEAEQFDNNWHKKNLKVQEERLDRHAKEQRKSQEVHAKQEKDMAKSRTKKQSMFAKVGKKVNKVGKWLRKKAFGGFKAFKGLTPLKKIKNAHDKYRNWLKNKVMPKAVKMKKKSAARNAKMKARIKKQKDSADKIATTYGWDPKKPWWTQALEKNQFLKKKEGDNRIIGAHGYQGPHGYQQPTGFQGKKGYQQPKGWEGPKGPQGKNGPVGEKGKQGPRGYEGPHGVKGAHGEKGPHGLDGPHGEKGPDGWKGPHGYVGPRGTIAGDIMPSVYNFVGNWLEKKKVQLPPDLIIPNRRNWIVCPTCPNWYMDESPSAEEFLGVMAGRQNGDLMKQGFQTLQDSFAKMKARVHNKLDLPSSQQGGVIVDFTTGTGTQAVDIAQPPAPAPPVRFVVFKNPTAEPSPGGSYAVNQGQTNIGMNLPFMYGQPPAAQALFSMGDVAEEMPDAGDMAGVELHMRVQALPGKEFADDGGEYYRQLEMGTVTKLEGFEGEPDEFQITWPRTGKTSAIRKDEWQDWYKLVGEANTKQEEVEGSEFRVIVEKAEGAKLGLDVDFADLVHLKVMGIKPGPIAEWNDNKAEDPIAWVQKGDLITSINGITGDANQLLGVVANTTGTLDMTVIRPIRTHMLFSQGSPEVEVEGAEFESRLRRKFRVKVEKSEGAKLGLDVDYADLINLKVMNVNPGLIAEWNAKARDHSNWVQKDDLITSINGNKGDANELLGLVANTTGTLDMTVLRPSLRPMVPSYSTSGETEDIATDTVL